MAERKDRLHIKGYSIIQNSDYFCYGIDAVLLADFVLGNKREGKKSISVFDLGTGNGIIPLLLCARCDFPLKVCGLEIQEKIADLAERTVKLNSLESEISIVRGDICSVPELLEKGSWDIVVSNPPYMAAGKGRISSNKEKMTARQELLCSLKDVVKAAKHLLKEGGDFFMIHRFARHEEILCALKEAAFNSVTFKKVKPFMHKEASMVLYHCRSDENNDIRELPPLVIYESQGLYSPEVKKIYENN